MYCNFSQMSLANYFCNNLYIHYNNAYLKSSFCDFIIFQAPQAHDVSAADTCELFAGFGDCVEFPVVSSGVVGASFLGGIRSLAKSRP